MVCPQDGILLSNEKKRTPEADNTDELKCIMLSERSQTQKAADCVMHFYDILEREKPEGQKTAAALGGRRGVALLQRMQENSLECWNCFLSQFGWLRDCMGLSKHTHYTRKRVHFTVCKLCLNNEKNKAPRPGE